MSSPSSLCTEERQHYSIAQSLYCCYDFVPRIWDESRKKGPGQVLLDSMQDMPFPRRHTMRPRDRESQALAAYSFCFLKDHTSPLRCAMRPSKPVANCRTGCAALIRKPQLYCRHICMLLRALGHTWPYIPLYFTQHRLKYAEYSRTTYGVYHNTIPLSKQTQLKNQLY